VILLRRLNGMGWQMDITPLLKMAKEELGPRWHIFVLVLLVFALIASVVWMTRETGDNVRAMWAWFAAKAPT